MGGNPGRHTRRARNVLTLMDHLASHRARSPPWWRGFTDARHSWIGGSRPLKCQIEPQHSSNNDNSHHLYIGARLSTPELCGRIWENSVGDPQALIAVAEH